MTGRERDWMYLIAIFALSILLAVGCSSPKSDSKEENAANCVEPENPYAQGSGHYAGYEWAEAHGGGDCNGQSQSFNEGCEEYEQHETDYQECLQKKN